MQRVVNVKLNEDAGVITIVGGKERLEINEHNKREFRYGLSVFFNGKFVLNFVLSPEEEELLRSDFKTKAVDDLNYILLAHDYKLQIMKNYLVIPDNGYAHNQDYYKELGIDNKSNNAWGNNYAYHQLRFTSNEPDAFCKAMRMAMLYPIYGNNLFHEIPKGEHITEENF